MKKSKTKLSVYILIFFTVSFLGWVVETVYCSALVGHFCDRGFLTLPFCTIYGFSILAVYLLIGTPWGGGLMLGKCRNRVWRLVWYFLLTMAIPTVAELLTGLFFDKIIGIRLWDYFSFRFNFMGYICLEMSLAWGFLITGFMAFLFPLIKYLTEKLPASLKIIIATVLTFATCTDLTWCFFKSLIH